MAFAGARVNEKNAMTISEFCDRHNACADGRWWALATGEPDMCALWARADVKPEWRVWIATRTGVCDDRTLRLFACWCARQVWCLLKDERSRNAVEVAERYAKGNATAADLAAARSDAWAAAAARRAAERASWAASWSAAGSAADSASWAAAWISEGRAAVAAQSKWLIENARPQFDR